MSEITLKDGRLFNSRFQDFETALADVNDYLFCEYDEHATEDDVIKFEVIEKVMEGKKMKTYYKVSFEYSEGIYCTNMAHAESIADVEKSYSKYTWCSMREAAPYELNEAKAKGMPIIEIEHTDN